MDQWLIAGVFFGSLISVALDWAFYDRMNGTIGSFWPHLADCFSYSQSHLARKLLIALCGGVITFAAMRDWDQVVIATAVTWFAVHCLIYLEWARVSKSVPRPDAES